MSENRK